MDMKALTEHFDAHHAEVKTALEGVQAQINEIEQKSSRSLYSAGGAQARESLGAQVVANPGLKEFKDRNGRHDRFQMEVKATITSATTNAAGSAGSGILPYRDPTMVPLLQRRPVVRDLVTVVGMEGSSVDVLRQAGRTNNAAPVAEGAAKPQSDMELQLTNYPARVIAHFMKASRQILDDVPQLQGMIDNELMDGVALVEDSQILSGDGTGQNLFGLIPGATAYAAAFTVTGGTSLDTIGLAMLQTALAQQPADGIVIHPSDWTKMTLLKDAEGKYILGPPSAVVVPRLWGVPVVPSQAMTAGNFLVGNFRNAATLYDRWKARVEVGTVNDDFTKNLVTLLCEERVALAVKQPTAVTYGAFGS